MRCVQCGKPVPNAAARCSHCYRPISQKFSRTPFPAVDMYDCPVELVHYDPQKRRMRQLYVDSLPETQQLRINEKANERQKNKVKIILIIGIIVSVFLLCFGAMFDATFSKFITATMPILLLGGGTLLVVFLVKSSPSRDSINYNKEIEIHLPKQEYYFNHRIVGYSKLEKTYKDDDGNVTYFYMFYEIDKANIKSIHYDSKYAEYVLTLHQPVYVDYNLPARNDFRIQDIFDDSVLSHVLSCDLPPKNIPF